MAPLRRILATVLLLACVPLASAADEPDEPMGPPAPRRVQFHEPQRVYTPAERAQARKLWPYYVAGWALDAGTTTLVFVRHGDAAHEAAPGLGHLLFRPIKNQKARAVAVQVFRAGLAWWSWRKGIKDPDSAKLRAVLWLAVGAAAGTWNITVAF